MLADIRMPHAARRPRRNPRAAHRYEVFAVMAVCSHATPNMKAKFMFRLYDFDSSESLSKHEFVIMLMSVLTGMSTATGSTPPPVTEIEFVSEVAFNAADSVVHDGKLTYMEYFGWISNSRRAKAMLSAFPARDTAIPASLTAFNGDGADGDSASGSDEPHASGGRTMPRQGTHSTAHHAVARGRDRRQKRAEESKRLEREAAIQKQEDKAAVLIQQHWRIKRRQSGAVVGAVAAPLNPRRPAAKKRGGGGRGGGGGGGGKKRPVKKRAGKKKRGGGGGKRKSSAAPKHQCKYTKAEILDLRVRFCEMDKDNSGSISFKEFRGGMEESGLYKEALGMFIALDKDLSGEVTFEELLLNLYPHANQTDLARMREWVAGPKEEKAAKVVLTKQQIDEMDAVFRLYDTDHSGTISVSELSEAMVATGVFSQDDIRKSFGAADIDHDGELSMEEFRDYFSDTYFVPTDYKLYDWSLKL